MPRGEEFKEGVSAKINDIPDEIKRGRLDIPKQILDTDPLLDIPEQILKTDPPLSDIPNLSEEKAVIIEAQINTIENPWRQNSKSSPLEKQMTEKPELKYLDNYSVSGAGVGEKASTRVYRNWSSEREQDRDKRIKEEVKRMLEESDTDSEVEIRGTEEKLKSYFERCASEKPKNVKVDRN